MRAIVLGSAAGGGFPQWNSGAVGCARARMGDPSALPRTQASLAVSGDGESWFVINASPDIRQQINASPALWPRAARHTPIAGVVLTGGEVDAVAGLLSLRERERFSLYATAPVLTALADNPIFGVLNPEFVKRVTVEPGRAFALGGMTATLVRVPGKVPLYLEGGAVDPMAETDDTVACFVAHDGRTLAYVPGCARLSDELRARLAGVDALLLDATLWDDDEMVRAGVGPKTGRRMGHLSVSGPEGSLAQLRDARIGRKIFTHMNNTNPLLLADSAERAEAERAGWEVAYDGMEFSL